MDSGDTSSTSEQRTRSRVRPLAVATIFVLLASSVVLRTVSGVDPFVAVGLVGVLAVLALALLWRLRGRPRRRPMLLLRLAMRTERTRTSGTRFRHGSTRADTSNPVASLEANRNKRSRTFSDRRTS